MRWHWFDNIVIRKPQIGLGILHECFAKILII